MPGLRPALGRLLSCAALLLGLAVPSLGVSRTTGFMLSSSRLNATVAEHLNFGLRAAIQKSDGVAASATVAHGTKTAGVVQKMQARVLPPAPAPAPMMPPHLQAAGAPRLISATRAAAPAPPPDPQPPKIPVIGGAECKILEAAIVVDPAPKCEHVVYSANWDGCMCAIPQPGNRNPMPDTLYNPFAQDIPPDPNIPGFPPMPTVPPPSNPLAPYIPPMMATDCPYADPCGDKDPTVNNFQQCVGFDSFGFSEVRKGKYSPASRFFNAIHCFYIMKPYDLFKVCIGLGHGGKACDTLSRPKKIEAFFHLQEKRGEVQTYIKSAPLMLKCKSETFSDVWHVFCEEMVINLEKPCETPWSKLWTGDCEGAPPPSEDFTAASELGEFCPFHCGFKKQELDWPFVPPDAPAPAPAA